jgi:cation diffusion facilitator family transporter
MHDTSHHTWQHSHDFAVKNDKGEKRTFYVLLLTFITMIVEIVTGSLLGSMALLADGWHMATHVAAFFITLFAYRYARTHANDPKYSFGTGKVNVLGGFASAVALIIVALVMLIESIHRIIEPQSIQFNEAILVAILGLLINIISAFLLKDSHHHHHGHEHHHDDHHHDHNLRAAYLHVLADALTSLLAIIALLAGKYLNWQWMDPIMGIVGAYIIVRWSLGLLKQTSPILLDASIEEKYIQSITDIIEDDSDNKITDLHVWKVGANDYAAIIALVTHYPQTSAYYKKLLHPLDKLSHVTIEVNVCHEGSHTNIEPSSSH